MRRYTSIPFSFRFVLRFRLDFMELSDVDPRSMDTLLPSRELMLLTHVSRCAHWRSSRHTSRVGPSGVEPASQLRPGVYCAGRFPETNPGPLNDESRLGCTGRLKGKTLENTPVTSPAPDCRVRGDSGHNPARFRSRETSVEWIAFSSTSALSP